MGRSVHHSVGLIYTSPDSYGGYTLFTSNGGDHATLLDVKGNVVHRWHNDEGISYAYLVPNGNLLCRTKPPKDVEVVHNLGGSSSGLIELDWEGNVVWRYDDPMLHHDFARMENGNTVALLFKELDEETTQKIKGGYTSDDDPPRILGDIIREVTPSGDTMKEWDISEALSFDEDVICPLEHRREWTHANCLNLTPEGDFLVSFRNTSTVGILSRDTGKFLWKWGPGNVWHQHHPTFLDNGNIQIFDNGSHSRGADRSRIVEVNPSNNQIEWEYTETPAMAFFSSNISSAERLPNGNTHICEGAFGRFFEVTREGDVVWEYINPFLCPDLRTGDTTNSVFRSHRYNSDHSVFKGRLLEAQSYQSINRVYGSERTDSSPLNRIVLA